MPDGNSRAYIYIIARLLKISKLPRILAVIFAKKRIISKISKKHGRGGKQKQRQVQKEPVPAFVVM